MNLIENEKGLSTIELIFSIIVCLGAWGWIWNIMKVMNSDFSTITGELVIRCIGILVAPIGCVVGFI
jgi:hypothetical protein